MEIILLTIVVLFHNKRMNNISTFVLAIITSFINIGVWVRLSILISEMINAMDHLNVHEWDKERFISFKEKSNLYTRFSLNNSIVESEHSPSKSKRNSRMSEFISNNERKDLISNDLTTQLLSDKKGVGELS